MPFNGSKRRLTRDVEEWKKAYEKMISASIDKTISPEKFVPKYIPGVKLFTDPSKGLILGYIDWSWWAVFLYPVSSLVYVIASSIPLDPSYIGEDDEVVNSTDGSVVCNLLAAIILVIDSLIVMLELYLIGKFGDTVSSTSISVENNDIIVEQEAISKRSLRNYELNNLFFMLGAVFYLIQGIWMINYKVDTTGCYSEFWCGTFWVTFFGALGYLISSCFCIYEGLSDRRIAIQEYHSGKNNFYPRLFTFNFKEFNWFLWGDIFYVITSIMFLIQPIFLAYADKEKYTERRDANYYLLTNVVMFIDSMLYQVIKEISNKKNCDQACEIFF